MRWMSGWRLARTFVFGRAEDHAVNRSLKRVARVCHEKGWMK